MWNQIPLSWKDYLKFLLEAYSVVLALGPLIMFLRTKSFDAIYTVFPFLFILSLLIMRVVEKEMYEVTRRMMKGKNPEIH